eukprot:s2301_g2.t1
MFSPGFLISAPRMLQKKVFVGLPGGEQVAGPSVELSCRSGRCMRKGASVFLATGLERTEFRANHTISRQITRAFPGQCSLRRHGGLQVPGGDVAQEAVGCDALLRPLAKLGVSAAACGAPLHQAHTRGQSPEDGLQGEAGLLHLPCAREARRPEEAGGQGHRLRQACEPRYQQVEGREKPSQHRGRAGRTQVRRPPGAELLLGGSGLCRERNRFRALGLSALGTFLWMLNGCAMWLDEGSLPDAVHKWFEVVMVDPYHKTIRDDPRINWTDFFCQCVYIATNTICKPVMKHRELRGLTAAGKKARGLLKKGKRATKLRPSYRAAYRRHSLMRLRRYR